MLSFLLGLLGVGGIAGLALNFFGPLAIRGFAGPLLGGIGAFIKKVPWQAWLALALAIFGLWLWISRAHALERAENAEAENAALCQAARSAASNPKLDCRFAAAQMVELGSSLRSTTQALDRQNAAVASWKAEADRQRAEAAKARKAAERRAGEAMSTAERLKASSAKAPPPGKECEPSDAMKGAWR